MPTSQRLRITVDLNKCVGSTICVQLSPRVFALNDQRQSSVVDPTNDTAANILEAAEGCPLGAIVVQDAETGRVLFGAKDAAV